MPTPQHDPDPHRFADLFTTTIDAAPVHFVRPSDTNRPSWVAYEDAHYLGTLHARVDTDGTWCIQATQEQHERLDDAVRALRRPPTWSDDREQVRQWARSALGDPQLLILDLQTSGLADPWAVQIGLTDRHGTALIDETINPLAEIDPTASVLHGMTADTLATAPPFSALLPDLGRVLHGRRCLMYNAAFDQGVLRRELQRHYRDPEKATAWLDRATWEDAMRPYATWIGLWAAHRHGYRYQPLGSTYNAIANCRRLLATLARMSR
ncbi:hypothetical protein GCM10010300_76940 [Streptomyces olivaceoviridis]|uniref:3'-5' exonuclease n=1 Tax=Streptomyces olivaceoviridis TaxID=1921 RepID=UPI00167A1D83|nr:3'-5' exonuclease [Streptomyces olivaceoviridis]GGZ21841.1 hypothetical protein GCM10010300_76940 [Streptomyces olivaceoviridis]